MKKYCHDCGVEEGHLHQEGCDWERCPRCKNGQQLLSCSKHSWSDLTDNEREPFFDGVSTCERCGKKSPDLFIVPDDEWKYVCGITYQIDCLLCKKCFDFIKEKRRKKCYGELKIMKE